MKLELSKKTIHRLLIALVILVVVGFVVYRMRTKSTYAYPGAAGTDYGSSSDAGSLYTLLDNNIRQCRAIKVNNDTFNADLCISSNISYFTSNSCPAVIDSVTSANCAKSGTGYSAVRDCNLTNWVTASSTLTTDLASINSAYTDLYLYAGQTVTGPPGSVPATFAIPASAVIDAAKRADVRAATRKYLATTCGDNKFYLSNTLTGTDVYTKLDSSALYKAWTVVSSGGAAPNNWELIPAGGGAGATYASYYFQDTSIAGGTAAYVGVQRFMKWYKKAADFNASGSEVEYTTLSPLQSTGSEYLTANSDGIPNWVIAQNIGPFTILATSTTANLSAVTKAKLPMTWYDGTVTKTVAYTIGADPYV
jgi:hypothetical protein